MLYLLFTLFLSIALSLILGLFSFITYFSGVSQKILGDHNHNIRLQNNFSIAKHGTSLQESRDLWIDEQNQVRDYVYKILDESKFFVDNSELKEKYETTSDQKGLAADFVDLEGTTHLWGKAYSNEEVMQLYNISSSERVDDLRLLSDNFYNNSTHVSANLLTKFFMTVIIPNLITRAFLIVMVF